MAVAETPRKQSLGTSGPEPDTVEGHQTLLATFSVQANVRVLRPAPPIPSLVQRSRSSLAACTRFGAFLSGARGPACGGKPWRMRSPQRTGSLVQ